MYWPDRGLTNKLIQFEEEFWSYEKKDNVRRVELPAPISDIKLAINKYSKYFFHSFNIWYDYLRDVRISHIFVSPAISYTNAGLIYLASFIIRTQPDLGFMFVDIARRISLQK